MHRADLPETIGNYRIISLLGEDAHGVIYQAEAKDSDQELALRVFPPEAFPDEQVRKQFLADTRALADINHPHLRRVHEAGAIEHGIYVAMEYLQGSTLKNLLVSGPVEVVAAVEWSAEVCEALEALHARGALHGYLRPEKVFITMESRVKLIDAGLWRLKLPRGLNLSDEKILCVSGLDPEAVRGMAPELLRGQPPNRYSDIYGLGLILYEILTGQNPFEDQQVSQTMHWVLGRTPPPPSQLRRDLPPELDQAVVRALAKEPESRFASGKSFSAAIRGTEAEEELAPLAPEATSWKLATPLWLAIGGVILVLLLWYLYLALTSP